MYSISRGNMVIFSKQINIDEFYLSNIWIYHYHFKTSINNFMILVQKSVGFSEVWKLFSNTVYVFSTFSYLIMYI